MTQSTGVTGRESSTEAKFTSHSVGSGTQMESDKALDELFVVAKGVLGMGGYMNMGIDLAFHSTKDKPALYNLKVSGLWGRTTIMCLRESTQQKGKHIARCTFDKFSPESKLEIKEGFSTMTRVGHDNHYWTAEGTNFTWKQMPTTAGKMSNFIDPDWKLIDRGSGEVHAVYVANQANSKNRGQVQFRRSLGLDWEKAVLLTLGTVVERARQKKARRGSFLTGMLSY